MLIPASPKLSPVDPEKGDKLPRPNAGANVRPLLSPNCPPKFEGRNSRINAVVPHVPLCPPGKITSSHCIEELERPARRQDVPLLKLGWGHVVFSTPSQSFSIFLVLLNRL